MAKAKRDSITTLSSLFRDPLIRDAFARAERDNDDGTYAFAECDHPRRLDGGAAEQLCQSTFRRSRALVEA
jgi:hypothetical protein